MISNRGDDIEAVIDDAFMTAMVGHGWSAVHLTC
jgi:hypothetical protein